MWGWKPGNAWLDRFTLRNLLDKVKKVKKYLQDSAERHTFAIPNESHAFYAGKYGLIR